MKCCSAQCPQVIMIILHSMFDTSCARHKERVWGHVVGGYVDHLIHRKTKTCIYTKAQVKSSTQTSVCRMSYDLQMLSTFRQLQSRSYSHLVPMQPLAFAWQKKKSWLFQTGWTIQHVLRQSWEAVYQSLLYNFPWRRKGNLAILEMKTLNEAIQRFTDMLKTRKSFGMMYDPYFCVGMDINVKSVFFSV